MRPSCRTARYASIALKRTRVRLILNMSSLLSLVLLSLFYRVAGQASPEDWDQLAARVQLNRNVPFAQSCFSGATHDATACNTVQVGYDDACKSHFHRIVIDTNFSLVNRTNSPAAYMNPQWESCQKSGAQCTLDYLDPTNPAAFTAPSICELGSVSSYYVRTVSFCVRIILSFNRLTWCLLWT